MAVAICETCGKEFYAKPFWLQKGWGKYCSAECHHKSMRNGEDRPCHLCGKVTYKTQKQLKKTKSGLFFCSKSCQTKWRNQIYIGEAHKNFKTGEFVYRATMERHNIPKICKICKTEDCRVLAVHHIDRNRKNNALSNLMWLCHNCHFLVHHYEDERAKIMVPMV
jgi:hypothetical protein